MNDTKLVVQADNLTAGYLPGINILNGCTLEAYQGELIGIIGPNGAGKSTLLKALFGLVNIRDGAVRLDGEDVTNLHTNQLVRKGVGFVPQTNNVFPSLSIEENLQMGLFLKPKEFSTRVAEMWELFPMLADRRKQRAGSLSGGERRRLEITRALITEPRFMLLDEPFAGIDPLALNDINQIIRKLKERGIGIIISDHNVRETLKVCDSAYIISQGKEVMDG